MHITITAVVSASRTLEPHPGAASLGAGETIDVGAKLGGGGFGTVHRCDAIAGAAGTGLVVKRHTPNAGIAPEDNAAVLAALHRAIDARWGAIPADARRHLPAVPYWVGRARWGADDAVISLSRDLGVEGYRGFDIVLADVAAFRAWLALDISDRMAAAHEFACSHALADEIDFVHADINVENVFVDPAGGRAAIIDWDSGVLPGSPNQAPLAWGKPDDFIAPEAKAGGVLDPGAIGPLTERWSVGYMVHYLLFGVGPLFFLSTLSDHHIAQYLAAHTWPDIDQASPLFNAPNRGFYSRYLQDLAELPASLVDLFSRFVTDGSADPGARPTSAQWRDALRGAASPASFDWVTLSSPVVALGSSVRVAWDAPGAQSVYVDGAGPLPAAGWTEVSPSATRALRLEATNPWGSCTHLTEPVVVVAAPSMPTLTLPAAGLTLPALALQVSAARSFPRLGPPPALAAPGRGVLAIPARLTRGTVARLAVRGRRAVLSRPRFRRPGG